MGEVQGRALGGEFQEFHPGGIEVQQAAFPVGDEDHVLGAFKDAPVTVLGAPQLMIEAGVFDGQADLVAQGAEEVAFAPKTCGRAWRTPPPG